MTLLDAILCLGKRERFTVYRPANPKIVNGRAVRSDPVQFEGVGAIQQSTPATLQTLPEGLRNREVLNIWTDCEIRTARVSESNEPDRLKIRGALFEVFDVNDRSREDGFFRGILIRVGQ